jgi:hypothetical protein
MWGKAKVKAAKKKMKNKVKGSEIKNVSSAKQFAQAFLKFDARFESTRGLNAERRR